MLTSSSFPPPASLFPSFSSICPTPPLPILLSYLQQLPFSLPSCLSLLLRCQIIVSSSACPVITFFKQSHTVIGPVSSYHIMKNTWSQPEMKDSLHLSTSETHRGTHIRRADPNKHTHTHTYVLHTEARCHKHIHQWSYGTGIWVDGCVCAHFYTSCLHQVVDVMLQHDRWDGVVFRECPEMFVSTASGFCD